MPTITNRATASKVVVVRINSFIGAGNGYTVALDGNDILGIGSGEHTEFLVPEGEHHIAVKCFGGWSPTWKEDSLKFMAKASESTFFLISPNATCAEIKPSNEAEAKKHLAGSKFISLELSLTAPTSGPAETLGQPAFGRPDQDVRATSIAAQPSSREVPSLKVVADCGNCQVRASVPGLIVEGYNSAAAESGAKLASEAVYGGGLLCECLAWRRASREKDRADDLRARKSVGVRASATGGRLYVSDSEKRSPWTRRIPEARMSSTRTCLGRGTARRKVRFSRSGNTFQPKEEGPKWQ